MWNGPQQEQQQAEAALTLSLSLSLSLIYYLLSRSVGRSKVRLPQTSLLSLGWRPCQRSPSIHHLHPSADCSAHNLSFNTVSSSKQRQGLGFLKDPISISTLLISRAMGSSKGVPLCRDPRESRELNTRVTFGVPGLLKFVDGRCHVESNPPTRLCMQCIGVRAQLFGRPRKISPR